MTLLVPKYFYLGCLLVEWLQLPSLAVSPEEAEKEHVGLACPLPSIPSYY